MLYFYFRFYNQNLRVKNAVSVMQEPTLSKENGPKQSEHSTQITEKQVYTNLYHTDYIDNGQTLTLNIDHTFHLRSINQSWDSHDQFTWNSNVTIEGSWSYDKELRKITLTATKFEVYLQSKQEKVTKGFQNRVVSTENFDIKSSKEIRCFIIRWDYNKFDRVVQGIIKRK